MRWIKWIAVAAVAVLAVVLLLPKPKDMGAPRFFADQTYNFEAVRVLTDTGPFGGDTGEASQAIAKIETGDAEGWYAAWNAEGDRVAALAASTNDPISKGNALMRAHTYYRAAEFFLKPGDAKRPAIWKKNIAAFYSGLDTLGVRYERIEVPYGQHHLNAVYYPGSQGAEAKPLIVVVGGFDSTMEELYVRQRGYSVLTYEGPGQGSVLRDQGVVFTPQWEKPNGAVLDTFLTTHAKPNKIVLMGESLGGYLAPRAAAFDGRIDGVIAYDVMFDGYAAAARSVPKFVFWLREHQYFRTLRLLSGLSADPGSTWARENGIWTMGVKTPFDVLDAFKAYTLAPVASRIHADVLAMAGADDHFIPHNQLEDFRKSLTNARSVTTVMYDRASGGGEHCQLGAPSLWHATVFDWIAAKFG
jgi:alpha-beta hydrolase superfamily lysophospholipase